MEAWEELITILPLYVPAVRPDVLTETVSVAGVMALGVTDNQVPPDNVVAVAVMLNGPPLLETRIPWAAGLGEPTSWLNASVPVGADNWGPEIASVTETACGLLAAPELEINTEPVYVPVLRPDGLTFTVSSTGYVS